MSRNLSHEASVAGVQNNLMALSMADLARVGAYFCYSGFLKHILRLDEFTGILTAASRDVAWYNFGGWEDSVAPLPSGQGIGTGHRVVVTALPPFVHPFRSIPETDALIEQMKRSALAHLPAHRSQYRKHLFDNHCSYGKAKDFKFIHFFCFTDVSSDLRASHADIIEEKLTQVRDEVAQQLDYPDLSGFGVLLFDDFVKRFVESGRTVREEQVPGLIRPWCADTPRLHDFSESVFQEYQRFVLIQDGNGRLRVAPASLHGFVRAETGLDRDADVLLVPGNQQPSSDALLALEDVINSDRTRESDLQACFENHPTLLSMFGSDLRVYPQLLLRRPDDGPLIPDFFLEPMDAGRAVILDLKLATQKIVLRKRNRDRFYANLHEYIAQMKEYGRYFDSYSNRRWFARKYAVQVFRPQLVLLVGKDYNGVDVDMVQRLRRSADPVELLTYTEMLEIHKSGRNLKA